MEVELFDDKVLRLVLEDRDAAAMSDWRRRSHNPKSSGFPRVISVFEFGFLQNTTINLPLRQAAKC